MQQKNWQKEKKDLSKEKILKGIFEEGDACVCYE